MGKRPTDLLKKKRLPIGIENFEKLRRKDYYYVDKTGLIRELLDNQAEVTLFTRPRRFGKSLNMSMLEKFFSLNGDKHLFDGLEIAEETELCEKYMGKYPVIFLSLKEIDAQSFDIAYRMAVDLIIETANQFYFLLSSEKLSLHDRRRYEKLLDDTMSANTLAGSLKLLCELLEKHFGKKVILLIDEYDVPLAKAHTNNFYDQMVPLIRALLGSALKSNDSLEFAVLTGCLRASKESIFTGLNNLKVMSITDTSYDEYFGFTDTEVRELLACYEMETAYDRVQEWYDGYRFGNVDVYCPWDVINYCSDARNDPDLFPQNYWANSSGNDAVREFVRRIDTESARQEMQTLAEDGTVRRKIRQELTYREMYTSIENVWSLLFMTGYLTSRTKPTGGIYELSIPNREIQSIFQDQILELFFEQSKEDGDALRILCQRIQTGDAKGVEQSVNEYLQRVISIRDTDARRNEKENFYHGLLLGLLQYKADWNVTSNYETGDGYGDILIRTRDKSMAAVMEVKYAHDGNPENGARDALRQIEDRRYADSLHRDQYGKIFKYGIGFYKKTCRAALGK